MKFSLSKHAEGYNSGRKFKRNLGKLSKFEKISKRPQRGDRNSTKVTSLQTVHHRPDYQKDIIIFAKKYARLYSENFNVKTTECNFAD